MSLGDLKVAIVHDELTRRGGAEIVLEELVRIFPQAHVYALYAGHPELIVDGRHYPIKTSFLQRLPLWFRRHPGRLLPLLPQAAEQFDLSSYDLVITSASGFAKSVVTRVAIPQVCYCHTPTRYLWSATHEVMEQQKRWLRGPGRVVLHFLRLADFAAAQRVDYFIANSRFTQERINTYYRRDSEVIFPPIDTSFYTPGALQNKDYFLVVGRLTATKNFDQAITVCEKLGMPLKVVGTGRELRRLKLLAGENTHFVGRVSAQELRDMLRGARAVLQPGEEDFGMAVAEALACGTPVIASKRGGAREIIEDRVTGLLYDAPGEEGLAEAVRQFLMDDIYFSPEKMQQSVLRFSRQRFRAGITEAIERILAE